MVWIWLILVFALGLALGSFLNVCIYRIPLEKSIFWPGSRCGHCFQKIRWYDNLPVISYIHLRGRCRSCKTPFSARYLLVELLTGLAFAGLFYLEVVVNINSLIYVDWPNKVPAMSRQGGLGVNPAGNQIQRQRQEILQYQSRRIQWGEIPWRAWVAYFFHATLLCFLIVITFCDLDRREIPPSVTIPGIIIGLVGATLLPWPWPSTPEAALADMPAGQPWWLIAPNIGPQLGIYPWPVWGPLPAWLAPGGNWQTGLATGLAGMLAGTFMLRAVRFLFSKGLGKEALGLGDADLMMMAGSFLGWQPVVTAFFIAALPGLVIGVFQLILRSDNSLPFGPSLALGVVITWLGWRWIGSFSQILFFNGTFLLILAGICCVFMLVASYAFRLIRLTREQGGKHTVP
jgi:leader peptidase (prepilin peptidase)/N-methyltransferase